MDEIQPSRSGPIPTLRVNLQHMILYFIISQTARTSAQTPDQDDASPADFLLAPADPTNLDTVFAAVTSSGNPSVMPSATDNADGTVYPATDSPGQHLLNYYFLLLAIFVVALAIAYWVLVRRKRRRIKTIRQDQLGVLARDLDAWPRRGMVGGWRHSVSNNDYARQEEGLDESGEAPPAYIKEPERAHLGEQAGMELSDLESRERKPPDYEAGPVR